MVHLRSMYLLMCWCKVHFVVHTLLMLRSPHFLAVNYRGSIGFGQELVDGLCGQVGTQDVKDVQVQILSPCNPLHTLFGTSRWAMNVYIPAFVYPRQCQYTLCIVSMLTILKILLGYSCMHTYVDVYMHVHMLYNAHKC